MPGSTPLVRELRAIDIAEQMRLAVAGDHSAVGADDQRRVVDMRAVTLRKAEGQRDALFPRDAPGRQDRSAVDRLGQTAHSFRADCIAGKKQFGSDEECRAGGPRLFGDAIETGKIALQAYRHARDLGNRRCASDALVMC